MNGAIRTRFCSLFQILRLLRRQLPSTGPDNRLEHGKSNAPGFVSKIHPDQPQPPRHSWNRFHAQRDDPVSRPRRQNPNRRNDRKIEADLGRNGLWITHRGTLLDAQSQWGYGSASLPQFSRFAKGTSSDRRFMPTFLTHPAVPISLALAGKSRICPSLLAAGIFVSVLPDADVVAFQLGIPYEHTLGHRGLSHSPVFAFLLAAAGSRAFSSGRRIAAFWFLFLSALSHGILDAATNGGLGVAFLSPISNSRFFLPWRPILVSPLSVTGFLTERGLFVLLSELLWVWAPLLTVALLSRLIIRSREPSKSTQPTEPGD